MLLPILESLMCTNNVFAVLLGVCGKIAGQGQTRSIGCLDSGNGGIGSNRVISGASRLHTMAAARRCDSVVVPAPGISCRLRGA